MKSVGCSIIGQTSDLAPADRRLYSIRDVTGTVESVPLITASILSKKIAARLQGLVMDVKTGNGAFMQTRERARELADSIIRTAGSAGLKTHALITDMNQVLGTTAGNAVEILESVDYLRNDSREARLDEVVLGLCAEMLLVGGIESDRDAARQRCDEAITSGRAAEIFDRMVAAMGGPTDFIDNADKHLPKAPVTRAVHADGRLLAVDTRKVGLAIIELGGGRKQVGETLDLAVGLSEFAPLGATLDAETPLTIVHAASEDAAERAEREVLAACEIGTGEPDVRDAVFEIMTA